MAKVQHTVTGCIPIDKAIIEAYVQLINTDKVVNEHEDDRQEAEGQGDYSDATAYPNTRRAKEAVRQQNELERQANEGTSEDERGANTRWGAEKQRQYNESVRQAAEGTPEDEAGADTRWGAEKQRQADELAREHQAGEDHTQYGLDHGASVAATERANNAAAAAEHQVDVKRGYGIASVTEPVVATTNGGVNTIRVTTEDNRTYDFYVRNGKSSEGLFATAADLPANPSVGDYAFVGADFPADIYICATAGVWTDSGNDYDGDSVDLTNYATKDYVSVSQNNQTGHTDINIGSDSYPVASVEEVNQLGQEIRLNKVFKNESGYSFSPVHYCILDFSVFGDIEPYEVFLPSQTIKPYSDNDTILVVNYKKESGDNYTSVVLSHDLVSSNLGVQRICFEGIRDNIYFVATIDFSKLESVGATYISQISFSDNCYKNRSAKYNEKVFNSGLKRYETSATLSIADNYSVGSIIDVLVNEGDNTFTNLKQRASLTNYNAGRIALTFNSPAKCFMRFLKVDNDDWVAIGMEDLRGRKYNDGMVSGASCSLSVPNKINDILGAYSEIYLKYNTKNLPDGICVLLGGQSFTIWQYISRSSNRYNIYISTNDISGSRLVEFESIKFEENTDYELYVKIYDSHVVFASLNGQQADEIDSETAIETSARGAFYIGSLNGAYEYSGIIKRIVASSASDYTGYVGLNILQDEYCQNANISFQLEPINILGGFWLDCSGNNKHAVLIDYPGIPNINVKTKEIHIENNITKRNLFNPGAVLRNKFVDSQYGKIYDYPAGTNGEVSAVALIPATKGKYYVIINPYCWNSMLLVGVGFLGVNLYGNSTPGNIILQSERYIICKAEYVANPSVEVDCLFFNLYRTAQTSPNPDETPLACVYEMDSVADAIHWLNTNFNDRASLPSDINIDESIISSNRVGTISTAYKDMSFLVFGDSISANHGWSNYIVNKFKLKHLYNVAIGGATLSGSYSGDGTPRNMIYQMLNCANSLGDVCYIEGENISGVYTKKIDCVIISMGFNDANNNRNNGVLSDVVSANWQTLAPANNDADFASVMAAFKYCIFYLKTTPITGTIQVNGDTINVAIDCTKAKFIYQTPIQTSSDGYSFTTPLPERLLNFERAIKEIAEYYSVPVICGRTHAGICREEELLYNDGKYLVDQIHPNADGYIKIGEMNASGLLSNFI